jgi:lipopolysaccharide/colanic/teichoic acid biosynthesis glycosyltransferase
MYKLIKRASDILASLLGIVIFLPLFIPLAIALRLTGEGYIFYLQERRGFKNRKFKIRKFATMLKASPSLGTGSITVKNDWRLTPLGKYLRGSKVNEFPQLINILFGEMSVVGPRPLMEVDFRLFSEEIQRQFYNCKPGLTGIASIIFRDEEKLHSETKMDPHEIDRLYILPYKGALELWYQNHCNCRTDIIIILLTVAAIFLPKNKWAFSFFKDLPKMPDFSELNKHNS